MSDGLRKLIEKKKRCGVLSGRDALIFWRHVRGAVDGGSREWTGRDFEQLTRWQFGLRTNTQFRIVAGPVGAAAPVPVEVPVVRPLLRRKYATVEEREAAQRAKNASYQARFRLAKSGVTGSLVSGT